MEEIWRLQIFKNIFLGEMGNINGLRPKKFGNAEFTPSRSGDPSIQDKHQRPEVARAPATILCGAAAIVENCCATCVFFE
jgi:hypothetical protein